VSAKTGTLPAIQIGMRVTIAIPVWEGQVSTTFDFAKKILVVETESGCEIECREVTLEGEAVVTKVGALGENGVQVFLCGSISRPLANAVTQAGIQAIPFVTGDVDDVLAAYICGQLDKPRFLQAGSHAGARRHWRQGRQGYQRCGEFCRTGVR